MEFVDFVLWGQKLGKRGRGADGKTVVFVAGDKRGRRLGRIRL